VGQTDLIDSLDFLLTWTKKDERPKLTGLRQKLLENPIVEIFQLLCGWLHSYICLAKISLLLPLHRSPFHRKNDLRPHPELECFKTGEWQKGITIVFSVRAGCFLTNFNRWIYNRTVVSCY
jgi:hypothetical protein